MLISLAVMKYYVWGIPTKRERCKWELPIGLAGISICTIAMRISIFYLKGNVKRTILLFLLTTISCLILYTYFILPYQPHCIYAKKTTKLGQKGSDFMTVLHLFYLLTSLKTASFLITENYWVFVIFGQCFYTIIGLTTTDHLFWVFTGNIWLNRLDDEKTISSKYSSPICGFFIRTPPYLPECKICYLAYTNFNRIPKILTKCGHTVCEICAKTLENNRAVTCPFCLTTTVIHPFDRLPVNFTVLDLLEDLNSNN